jgi:hypothetical protein
LRTTQVSKGQAFSSIAALIKSHPRSDSDPVADNSLSLLRTPSFLRLLSKVLSKISNERAEPIKTRRQTFSTNKTTRFPGKFDRIFRNGVLHKNGQQGLDLSLSMALSDLIIMEEEVVLRLYNVCNIRDVVEAQLFTEEHRIIRDANVINSISSTKITFT